MTRLAKGLAIALLAWSVMAADALAQGRWQQVENKANCAIWNAVPSANETLTWTGVCKNGKAEGRGELVFRYLKSSKWEEGIYRGNLRRGKLHGSGVYVHPEFRYEGNFKDGEFHGRGVFTAGDGFRYEGDFMNTKLHGSGVLVQTNGDRYEGEFKDGKLHGSGVLVQANGDRYEGEFRDGSADGRGVYVFSHGDRYEGDFKDRPYPVKAGSTPNGGMPSTSCRYVMVGRSMARHMTKSASSSIRRRRLKR